MEKDKGGEAVPAFDCCFHPEALLLSSRSKQFRDLLVSTAISGIEEAFRRQRQEVTLSKEFHVLKGIAYKSGQIPTMLIDLAGKSKWNEPAAEVQDQTPAPNSTQQKQQPQSQDKSTKTTAAAVAAPAPVAAIQKGFLNKPAKASAPTAVSGSLSAAPGAPPPLVQVVSEDDRPAVSARKAPVPVAAAVSAGPVSPEYSMTERGVLSLGDFGSMGGVQVSSTRPAELVYRIDIPLVAKTSEVELDVGER
jgi:hypothetical protein